MRIVVLKILGIFNILIYFSYDISISLNFKIHKFPVSLIIESGIFGSDFNEPLRLQIFFQMNFYNLSN
jgi:hypothetical protein